MDQPAVSPVSPAWMRGKEQIPWSWAVERLESERNYWLATVRTDGFPQARPVWGVWTDSGLFLSVGHGGLQRTGARARMPITVHVDSAMDVVIIEGVIDRVARFSSPEATREPTLEVDPSIRRVATERYNAKYSWNFELDGGGVNFLVRPHRVYAWHSSPTEVESSARWTFPKAQ